MSDTPIHDALVRLYVARRRVIRSLERQAVIESWDRSRLATTKALAGNSVWMAANVRAYLAEANPD